MENLNITYLGLAFLGMCIHVLTRITNRKDKTQKISLKAYLSEGLNWVRMILALFSTIAVLLMADDIGSVLQIQLADGSPAKTILAFLAGYWNHSIIRSVLAKFAQAKN